MSGSRPTTACCLIFGHIEYDDTVWLTAEVPAALIDSPTCSAARNLERIA